MHWQNFNRRLRERNSKMNKEKKNHLEIFQKYLHAIPQLVLSNLMFAIPMLLSIGLVWIIESFTVQVVFIQFLPILLLMPFYCGLCKISKDVVIGKEVRGIRDFFKAVKANLKFSIIHGVIFYLVAMIDYFALLFYYQAGKYNGAMYIVFGLCLAVAIVSVFCLFYVPVITVTLDIPFKFIYKNAALMSIGELPKNLLALFSCAACIAIVTTLFSFTGNYVGAFVTVFILLIVILPVTMAYFITAIIYPSIDKLLIDKSGKNLKESNKSNPADRRELIQSMLEENPIDPAILEGDENELVFYGGKMIKRAKLIEMYKSVNE